MAHIFLLFLIWMVAEIGTICGFNTVDLTCQEEEFVTELRTVAEKCPASEVIEISDSEPPDQSKEKSSLETVKPVNRLRKTYSRLGPRYLLKKKRGSYKEKKFPVDELCTSQEAWELDVIPSEMRERISNSIPPSYIRNRVLSDLYLSRERVTRYIVKQLEQMPEFSRVDEPTSHDNDHDYAVPENLESWSEILSLFQ